MDQAPYTDPARYRRLHSVWLRWPVPGGPWWINVHFGYVAGRLEAVGMDLRHGIGPDAELLPGMNEALPITSTAIRKLNVAAVVDEARRRRAEGMASAEQAASAAGVQDAAFSAATNDLTDEPRATVKAPRPGRKVFYPPEHWESVAEAYREALANGLPARRSVQERFHVSETTAARWIYRLRHELHLIGPTTRGRAAETEPPRSNP